MTRPFRYFVGWVAGTVTALTLYSGLIAWQLRAPTENSRWYAEIAKKKIEIASARSESGRIFFVGGSNVLFGIDAKLFESRTGVPAVNYGLGAAMGLELMLQKIESQLRPGDIVVLSPEYELLNYSLYQFDNALTDYLISRDPEAIERLSFIRRIRLFGGVSWIRILEGVRVKLGMDQHRTTNRGYDSSTIDSWGNETVNQGSTIGDHDLKPANILTTRIPPDSPAWVLLASFFSSANSKGVRVFWHFPSLVDSAAADHRGESPPLIKQISGFLDQNRISTLGSFQDLLFPKLHHYDTKYHLNSEGRQFRTERLIRAFSKN